MHVYSGPAEAMASTTADHRMLLGIKPAAVLSQKSIAVSGSTEVCSHCFQPIDKRYFCLGHRDNAQLGHDPSCPRYQDHVGCDLIPRGAAPAQFADY